MPVIGYVPEHIMSSPANDEAGQEALGDGLQHGARKHVDPQLGPPETFKQIQFDRT